MSKSKYSCGEWSFIQVLSEETAFSLFISFFWTLLQHILGKLPMHKKQISSNDKVKVGSKVSA